MKSNNQNNNPQNQMSDQSADFGIFCVCCLLLYLLYEKFMAFHYIPNFRLVWMSVAMVFAFFVALALRWWLKKTEHLEEEGALLSHLTETQDPQAIEAAKLGDLPLMLDTETRQGHVQILGTTGRGKTQSIILPWITRDLHNGVSSIVIDGKGERDLVEKIKRNAPGDAKVHVFDLSNPELSCIINPLEHGSPQQIADQIFASFDFEDSYYKAVQMEVTILLLRLLKDTEKVVTLKRVYELLTDDKLLAECAKKTPLRGLKACLRRYLETPKRTRDENMKGLVSQLAPFAVGEIEALVNGKATGKDAHRFQSLAQLVLRKQPTPTVFLFLIPTLKYQQLGKQLGKMLLQQISALVGDRCWYMHSDPSFLPIYLDEFSSFAYTGFEQLLNKARSSRVALHLSHQSLADLKMVSDSFAQIVNTNTNVKCLMGLNDPETADFYARHLGTQKSQRRTERVQDGGIWNRDVATGQASIRDVEEYKVHPNLLKAFTAGLGVLHVPTLSGNLTAVVQFTRLESEVGS